MSAGFVLMAKAPRVGEAKTRVGAVIGMEAAAQLQRAFILDWLERTLPVPAFLDLTGHAPTCVARAEAAGWSIAAQVGSDLGERMRHALRLTAGPTVVVGSDVVTLPVALIEQAIAALSDADLVLGPSRDGGFYLIAARDVPEHLFDGLAWSHARVFEQTRAQARALGLRVHALPLWYDVDNVADLRWLGLHCAEPFEGLMPHRPRHTLALAAVHALDTPTPHTGLR